MPYHYFSPTCMSMRIQSTHSVDSVWVLSTISAALLLRLPLPHSSVLFVSFLLSVPKGRKNSQSTSIVCRYCGNIGRVDDRLRYIFHNHRSHCISFQELISAFIQPHIRPCDTISSLWDTPTNNFYHHSCSVALVCLICAWVSALQYIDERCPSLNKILPKKVFVSVNLFGTAKS